MRTRGKGWRRQSWYSICSRHREYDENCRLCAKGYWKSDIAVKAEYAVYRLAPWLWRWWVNRPGSEERRRIEEWFPKMKHR